MRGFFPFDCGQGQNDKLKQATATTSAKADGWLLRYDFSVVQRRV
jgi:hypothetical protein